MNLYPFWFHPILEFVLDSQFNFPKFCVLPSITDEDAIPKTIVLVKLLIPSDIKMPYSSQWMSLVCMSMLFSVVAYALIMMLLSFRSILLIIPFKMIPTSLIS